MPNFIVINRPDAKVYYAETACGPIEAVQQGDIRIGGETTDYERTRRDDIDAIWDVYAAPDGFQDVAADDVEIVKTGCTYEVTFKAA